MIAVLDTERELLAATRAARERGCEIVDVHTPYPVHGLDKAMGLKPSRLSWVCFGCGAAGTLLAWYFQHWTSAVDWPINVGGKPWDSLPAFVPVIFETCVLFAGLGVVFALLVRCRLWPGRKAELPGPGITNDRFVIVARARNQEDLRELFESHGAEIIEEAPE